MLFHCTMTKIKIVKITIYWLVQLQGNSILIDWLWLHGDIYVTIYNQIIAILIYLSNLVGSR